MSENVFLISTFLGWLFVGGLILLYFFYSNNLSSYIKKILLINVVFFIFVSLIWFYKIAGDGISQVIGIYVYLGYGIIICIIQMIILKFMEKKIK